MKTTDFIPVHEFLTQEITPEEFVHYLDTIEHECSQSALSSPERFDDEVKEGLHYLHAFRKSLMQCK